MTQCLLTIWQAEFEILISITYEKHLAENVSNHGVLYKNMFLEKSNIKFD